MFHVLSFILFLFICNYSAAQTINSFLVKAGSSLSESIPVEELYQYPSFKPGIVYFKSGDKSAGNLNYNRYLDEVQFIDPKGDTLSIADEPTIKLIAIGNDSFYWDAGYVKLVEAKGSVKLAVKQVLKVADSQKIGAYDMASSTTSITAVTSITNSGRRFDLAVKEDLVVVKQVEYFLGDAYNHFVLVNKKNLLDLFAKNKESVKAYLKNHEVAFTSKDDLQKLTQFLGSL